MTDIKDAVRVADEFANDLTAQIQQMQNTFSKAFPDLALNIFANVVRDSGLVNVGCYPVIKTHL